MSENDLEDPPAKSNRSPLVAALLSLLLFGGAGQIYLGQTKKGIGLVTLTILSLVGLGIGFIIIPIVGAVDAYILASQLEQGQALGAWDFFWQRHFEWRALLAQRTVYATRLEKTRDWFLGFIAWFMMHALYWGPLLVLSSRTSGPAGIWVIFCMPIPLPINLVALILLSRQRRWLAVGAFSAIVANSIGLVMTTQTVWFVSIPAMLPFFLINLFI